VYPDCNIGPKNNLEFGFESSLRAACEIMALPNFERQRDVMKRASLAVISALGLAAPAAHAADIAVKASPPAATPYSWTGLYFGGNVGGAWSRTDWTFTGSTVSGGTVAEAFSQDASSWMGGGQVGGRYQFSPNWVAGIEASWSGTDLKDTSVATLLANRLRQSKIFDLLLVTGSVGYASNNWLTYVKGGYANAESEFNTFVASTGQVTTTSSRNSDGWTVGAGVEYGFTQYISAGIEYDFARIDIGNHNQIVAPSFFAPATVTAAHSDIQAVMARLNFKLGQWWH